MADSFYIHFFCFLQKKEEFHELVSPKPRPYTTVVIPDPPPATVPYVGGSSSATFSASADAPVDKPAEVEEGDLLIVILAKNGSSVVSAPEDQGWLRIAHQTYGSGVPITRAWWKKATDNEPASYAFSSGSSTQSGRIDLLVVKNWNGSAPIATSSTTANSTANFNAPDILPISAKDDLLISVLAVAAASGLTEVTWTSPDGMTEHTDLSTSPVTLSTASLTLEDNTNAARTFTSSTLSTARVGAGISILVPATASRPVVKVYRGGAAKNEYLPQGVMQAFLSHPDIRFDVRSIGENEVEKLTAENLAEADYYIQPGGPTIQAGWPFVEAQKQIIKDYIDGGGKYLGFCLGAYFGRNAVNSGYELLPDGVFAYRYTNASGTNPGATDYVISTTAYIKLNWRDQPVRDVMIADGAYFTENAASITGAVVLARYNTTNQIAALTFPYGTGKVSLVGLTPNQ